MITLELTEEETRNLVIYLGLHSVGDLKYDTYSIFTKLYTEEVAGEYPPLVFTELMENTSIINGLFVIDGDREIP
jgi:hypothetical protein